MLSPLRGSRSLLVLFPWAYAHGYVLPSLRDSGIAQLQSLPFGGSLGKGCPGNGGSRHITAADLGDFGTLLSRRHLDRILPDPHRRGPGRANGDARARALRATDVCRPRPENRRRRGASRRANPEVLEHDLQQRPSAVTRGEFAHAVPVHVLARGLAIPAGRPGSGRYQSAATAFCDFLDLPAPGRSVRAVDSRCVPRCRGGGGAIAPVVLCRPLVGSRGRAVVSVDGADHRVGPGHAGARGAKTPARRRPRAKYSQLGRHRSGPTPGWKKPPAGKARLDGQVRRAVRGKHGPLAQPRSDRRMRPEA